MHILTARWPGLALVLSLSSMILLPIGWAKGPPSSSSSLIQPMCISRPPIGVGREKNMGIYSLSLLSLTFETYKNTWRLLNVQNDSTIMQMVLNCIVYSVYQIYELTLQSCKKLKHIS